MKAERLDSSSPPIKLLDFLHLLTNKYSVKPPIVYKKILIGIILYHNYFSNLFIPSIIWNKMETNTNSKANIIHME